jgi:type IV pilus biogenesis protein CpaD/CtpE
VRFLSETNVKQWIVPAAATALLTGCVSTATKTIDAQALGTIRNQNIARTVREKPDFGVLKPSFAPFGAFWRLGRIGHDVGRQ